MVELLTRLNDYPSRPVTKPDLLNKTEHPMIKLETRASLRKSESFKRLSEIQATKTARVITTEVLEAMILFFDVGN